eukprot:7718953-Pyramimonas_sp.AAC.1
MHLKRKVSKQKKRTDSLGLMTKQQMRDQLHYDEATIAKAVKLNEEKNWWRPDKLMPNNVELRRYLVDVGGGIDAISMQEDSVEVSGAKDLSNQQAIDMLEGGLLGPGADEVLLGEQGALMDDVELTGVSADGKTDEEKQRLADEREHAKAEKLAKRTPMEKAQDLMTRLGNEMAECSKAQLMCEDVSLAKPTHEAL